MTRDELILALDAKGWNLLSSPRSNWIVMKRAEHLVARHSLSDVAARIADTTKGRKEKMAGLVGFVIWDARFKASIPGQTFESRADAEAHIARLVQAGQHPDSEFHVVRVPLSERWRSVKAS